MGTSVNLIKIVNVDKLTLVCFLLSRNEYKNNILLKIDHFYWKKN